MRFPSQKKTAIAILVYLVMCVPVAHAAFTGTTTAQSASTPVTSRVGASELRKAIIAEKARLAQLKKTAHSAPGIAHTLKRRSSGEEVRLLQEFLGIYGTFSAPRVTGYFGTQTALAVREFQRKESLDTIGAVGPKTRARILALSSRELTREKMRRASSSAETVPEVTDVIFSTEVGEDGSGVGSTTVFASTTKNIYAILTLVNAKQDTAIGLIRYYKDVYIDSEVTHPSRTGLRYTHFQWSLKTAENRVPGPYIVTFYVNGKKLKTATFTVN